MGARRARFALPFSSGDGYTDSSYSGRVSGAELSRNEFYAGFGAAAGLLANYVVLVCLYHLASTGEALPAGPHAILQALDSLSLVIVTSIIGAATVSRAQTGYGLPDGPFRLLALAESLSFLSLSLGLVIFPLLWLHVVGDPQTSLVNVPQIVEPLVASASGAISTSAAAAPSILSTRLTSLLSFGAAGLSSLLNSAANAIEALL